MNIYIYIVAVLMMATLVHAEDKPAREDRIILELLNDFSETKKLERNTKRKGEREDNLIWMTETFTFQNISGDKISTEDVKKLDVFYSGYNKEEKLHAFSFFPFIKNIDEWHLELDKLATVKDKDYVVLVCDIMEVKLSTGTYREKVILANKEALLKEFEKIRQFYSCDSFISEKLKKVISLSEEFKGKKVPEVSRAPTLGRGSFPDSFRRWPFAAASWGGF